MAWNRRHKIDRTAAVFAAMLVVSIVSLVSAGRGDTEPGVDKPGVSLVQIQVPLQNLASQAAKEVTSISDHEFVDADKYRQLQKENEALRNLLESYPNYVKALENENRQLRGLEDMGISSEQFQLIRARIVGEDALSWRSSVLINRGSLSGIKTGSLVSSDYLMVSEGSRNGVRNGLRVLAGESLIGSVIQVGTHTARIRLLSDPGMEMPVSIHFSNEEGIQQSGALFWMVGLGRHGIRIRDVDHGYIDRGNIQVGNAVMTSGDDPRLPISVTIGTIAEIKQDPHNGLLYNLTVKPIVLPKDINRVYIIDPGEGVPD